MRIVALSIVIFAFYGPAEAKRRSKPATPPTVTPFALKSPFGGSETPVYRVRYGWMDRKCANRSTFCRRCRTAGTRAHKGVDLVAPIGTKVFPVTEGRVVRLRRTDGGKLGLFVVLEFPLGCANDPQTTCVYATYAHLSKVYPQIKRGVLLKPSEPLGETGISGNAKRLHLNQHHLHLEFSTYPGFLKERIDPSKFLRIRGNTPQNNAECVRLDRAIRRTWKTRPGKRRKRFTGHKLLGSTP